jgi:hypothetical protein
MYRDGQKITCHTALKGECHHKSVNLRVVIISIQQSQNWRGLTRDLPL